MVNQAAVPVVERKKVVSIMVLFATSIAIILCGVTLGVISLVNNVSFTVLSSQVHGGIFGAVIVFLGVRYFISVQKLRAEVYKSTSRFSWSNFKKEKRAK